MADDPKPDPQGEPEPSPQPEPEPKPEPEGEPEPSGDKPETDWKAHSRKWEREAKKARKEAEERAARLKEFEDAQLSEAEKATKRIEELEAAASAKADQVRRAFLKAAIADSQHRVASVNDAALLLLSDGLEFGDDDQPIELESKLGQMLEQKPYLRAGAARPSGDSDGGKGSGGGRDLEGMSVEDHFEEIRRTK